ncbi:hypothetical protein BMS3Bbin12_00576 [bacterium BMS3Bbin12]|nr:hypothetical protein BMS3Bbin12_00576 [bacterium BMS3Bbin12]GBE50873.1 hypothetical protein BMS3Bbin13_01823 [bacterium BMS3Bbin13]
MREPNFSESQLQQAVNAAFIRHVFEVRGEWAFANIPSLCAEYDLGWDTAFYFRWLPHPPVDEHEGCNFFIQYKLSGLLTSAGAKQWEFWRSEYFRFKIPHSTQNDSGEYIDDYHQWDRLKELANKNYPTFYATNDTLSKSDIKTKSDNGSLLGSIPILDVRHVNDKHKFVTFTNESDHFLLHSEKEEVNKVDFSRVIERLFDEPMLSMTDSNNKILSLLERMAKDDEMWNQDLSKIVETNVPYVLRPWVMRSKISWFVRKHIGVDMLWMPKNG